MLTLLWRRAPSIYGVPLCGDSLALGVPACYGRVLSMKLGLWQGGVRRATPPASKYLELHGYCPCSLVRWLEDQRASSKRWVSRAELGLLERGRRQDVVVFYLCISAAHGPPVLEKPHSGTITTDHPNRMCIDATATVTLSRSSPRWTIARPSVWAFMPSSEPPASRPWSLSARASITTSEGFRPVPPRGSNFATIIHSS